MTGTNGITLTLRGMCKLLYQTEHQLEKLRDDVWNKRELIRVLKREIKRREIKRGQPR